MAKATERHAATGIVGGKGDARSIKTLVSTVELAASASGVTIDFGRIPSNARILPNSTIYRDDLATSGAPTLDLGLAAVDSNITTDPDALNNGLALATAGNSGLLADFANAGLPAWDFVSGQSSDPGGSLIVQGTVKDALTSVAGTLSLELFYYLD